MRQPKQLLVVLSTCTECGRGVQHKVDPCPKEKSGMGLSRGVLLGQAQFSS